VLDGALTIAALRSGGGEACTLDSPEQSPVVPFDISPADPALLAALRARGSVRLPAISIVPDAIANLVSLAWLDQRRCCDPEALADAVVALATSALAEGLRAGSCDDE
jgi:hypothetical protein